MSLEKQNTIREVPRKEMFDYLKKMKPNSYPIPDNCWTIDNKTGEKILWYHEPIQNSKYPTTGAIFESDVIDNTLGEQ